MFCPPKSQSDKEVLQKVVEFIDGGSRQPSSKPGFAHAIKTSYATIDPSRLSLGDGSDDKTLIYRYKFSDDVAQPTVGLLSALQDDLGTICLFRVGLPSAPGVSLQMQTELVKPLDDISFLNNNNEIDIVNVVTKLGRTISFTKTYFRTVDTHETIAYATHVKYMPTGSRIADFLFNSPLFFVLYKIALVIFPAAHRPVYEEKELFQGVIGKYLEHHGIGQSTFHVNMKEHANPSGAMHGGCIAMVIEQAAEAFVKAAWNNQNTNATTTTTLEAMQIEYLSAIKGSSGVNISCQDLGHDEQSFHVRVLVKKGDRIASDGKLRFSRKQT